jgi:hypothetical protein
MRVVVEDGRRYSAATTAERPDALVVIGTRTLDRRGRDRLSSYLREGGRVLLSLGPDVDVPTLGEALGLNVRLLPEPVTPGADDGAIIPSDRRHPVWRQLAGSRSALGRLPIERYRQVLDDAGWDVLARFAGGAVAFAERTVERGTVLLFASDLDNRWNPRAGLRAVHRRNGALPDARCAHGLRVRAAGCAGDGPVHARRAHAAGGTRPTRRRRRREHRSCGE